MKAMSPHLKSVFIFTILSNSCYSFESAPSKRFTLSFSEFINNFKNIYSIKLPDIKLIGIDLLYFLITYVSIAHIVLTKADSKIDDLTKNQHKIIKILSRLLSMSISFAALDIIFAMIPLCRYQVINAAKLIIVIKLLEFFMSPFITGSHLQTAPASASALSEECIEANKWMSEIENASNKEDAIRAILKIHATDSIDLKLNPLITKKRNDYKITALDLFVESSSINDNKELKAFLKLIKQLINTQGQEQKLEALFDNHFNSFNGINQSYKFQDYDLEELTNEAKDFYGGLKNYTDPDKIVDNSGLVKQILEAGEKLKFDVGIIPKSAETIKQFNQLVSDILSKFSEILDAESKAIDPECFEKISLELKELQERHQSNKESFNNDLIQSAKCVDDILRKLFDMTTYSVQQQGVDAVAEVFNKLKTDVNAARDKLYTDYINCICCELENESKTITEETPEKNVLENAVKVLKKILEYKKSDHIPDEEKESIQKYLKCIYNEVIKPKKDYLRINEKIHAFFAEVQSLTQQLLEKVPTQFNLGERYALPSDEARSEVWDEENQVWLTETSTGRAEAAVEAASAAAAENSAVQIGVAAGAGEIQPPAVKGGGAEAAGEEEKPPAGAQAVKEEKPATEAGEAGGAAVEEVKNQDVGQVATKEGANTIAAAESELEQTTKSPLASPRQ